MSQIQEGKLVPGTDHYRLIRSQTDKKIFHIRLDKAFNEPGAFLMDESGRIRSFGCEEGWAYLFALQRGGDAEKNAEEARKKTQAEASQAERDRLDFIAREQAKLDGEKAALETEKRQREERSKPQAEKAPKVEKAPKAGA